MVKKTPLYDAHLEHGAKMVEFGGWSMPINYGSQLEEHHQVRRDVGMFDVSHMTIVDLHGDQVRALLRQLMANNVDRLKQTGKALYSCMLNESAGVIDDLIIYFLDEKYFRVILNAANRDNDIAWIETHAQPKSVEVRVRDDLSMIAVQGPNARSTVDKVLEAEYGSTVSRAAEALNPFFSVHNNNNGELFIARTGYTGEDGYEVILPAARCADLWQSLYNAGARPIGLGARDTLRLEAGMNLHGTDMDESTSPLESGLGWTIAWEPVEREFIGRPALEAQRHDANRAKWVGLVLQDRGVLRSHQQVLIDGHVVGETTSGSFSPTLGQSIAFARIKGELPELCQVTVRGRQLSARIVKPPFVRHGKPCT
ncbi:MAG: glycine cleavage system aminomethyltransferase GcvT [Gammaproteobacteria bacterium]|nr:glycine cleavage system aminomethyltransferase GcvT [Gammaproteobacteria bacterium]